MDIPTPDRELRSAAAARAEQMAAMPFTVTLDGPPGTPVVIEHDATGSRFEISAETARALAADLETMADESGD